MRAFHRALLLCLAVLLSACSAGSADREEMSMRVYQVPPDRAQAVMVSLNQALAMNRAPASEALPLGQASLGGDGQIIVLAANSLHPSIEKSLETIMASQPADSGARERLRLRFWSVDMLAGAQADSAGLASVENALSELREKAGDVHFVLRDSIESISTEQPHRVAHARRDWDSVRVGTEDEAVRQSLTYAVAKANGRYTLEFQFSDANHPGKARGTDGLGIYTTTTVQLGQTLVLASQPVMPVTAGSTGATRYYIVRVEPTDAAGTGDAG